MRVVMTFLWMSDSNSGGHFISNDCTLQLTNKPFDSQVYIRFR